MRDIIVIDLCDHLLVVAFYFMYFLKCYTDLHVYTAQYAQENSTKNPEGGIYRMCKI